MNHIAKTTKNNSIKTYVLVYESEIIMNKNEETFNNTYNKIQIFYKKIKRKTKKKMNTSLEIWTMDMSSRVIKKDIQMTQIYT